MRNPFAAFDKIPDLQKKWGLSEEAASELHELLLEVQSESDEFWSRCVDDRVRMKVQTLEFFHALEETQKLLKRRPVDVEAVARVLNKDPLELQDITPEDKALVADFYKDACHAEWCEYDQILIEYIAARSRLNGAASLAGVIGMAIAIANR